MSTLSPQERAAIDAALVRDGIAPAQSARAPINQEVAQELLRRHHAARKSRDEFETRLGRKVAPFSGELSELMLLDLVDAQVHEGAYFPDPGVSVWSSNLDNPNRTAQDAHREARQIENAWEASQVRAQVAKLEASIVYGTDADGNTVPVGSQSGVRIPEPR